ncbi:MAG TPA: NirD/YgiW/YdeI family stress tolerance protein [Burkholderiales bacterium]|nr:NirD/YgiW/YdeI family stress tolerance protein [Burkholderiales bacterium]
MRKLMYGVPIVLLFGVTPAAAQKPVAPITSAQSVAAAKDAQIVKLRGEIVSKQSGSEYVFSDGTGSVVVAIGEKVLKGKALPSGTPVEIVGQVDKGILRQSKVEVQSVTVLAASGPPGEPADSVM